MFINNPKPSQAEANDEMVWHNNLLAADSSTTSTSTATGFAPASHNGFDQHEWNKSVNLEDFCQTAQTNHPTSPFVHNPYQFDPSSTSHLGVGMNMEMMTSFNTSFDSASSPSVGATWSESSPEYETCRQHEAQDNNNNNNNNNSSSSANSTTSGSFHRPSTTESSSNGKSGNDAQSFSPTSDASWGSSPAPQIQGSYMDFSDTTGTTTTSAAVTSPKGSSMSAYPGQGRRQQQQRAPQQQQQPTDFTQTFSDASASFETDGLFNNNVTSTPPHQQMPSDFAIWSAAPSSQPSIILDSSPFVHQNQAQAEPRWRALHEYSLTSSVEPIMDEPRLTSSSSLSLVDNMSEEGGSMSATGMPSSPITNPFHNTGAGAGVTGHHSLAFDGLPSPTHSSLGFGRQGSVNSGGGGGGGGVSLQHQQQQQQFPSVMLNGGQLAASSDPFGSTGGGNFSHHLSSSPPNNGGSSGGEILFRGPISHRTVFDYPSSLGPSHFDGHDSSPILKSEGPLSVSPSSLWMNNNHQQQHKSQPPHSLPESSPIGANTFFGTQQNQSQMPLPLDFGVNNAEAAQFGNGHFNNQLHPHYLHQQQRQQQSREQRKSLPHTPPRRMGMGMGNGGGGRPPSPEPRFNPAGMITREMLPSHPNSSPWGVHHGQGHPHGHGLPHHHQQLMIKPNTLPSQSHHPQYHPSHAMSHSHRRQQPFHHRAHPYQLSSSPQYSNKNKRRTHGHQDSATDSIKRARAEQDALLVRLRKQGKSYKQIRQIGKFTEAESTLRGRYRTLTKSREERVRRPEWTDKDLRLLERAVRTLKKGPLAVTYSNPTNSRLSTASSSTSTPGPGGDQAMSITSLVSSKSSSAAGTSCRPSSTTNSATRGNSRNQSPSPSPSYTAADQQPRGIPITTTKIPWKQVSHYIFVNGGTYKFGNATVRKRWEELMRTELAKGKDLDKPFYEQRSKRSPYNLQQQAGTSASFSSRIGVASRAHGGGSSRSGGEERVARREIKTERERDDDGEPNLAYSDWLDMSALGDDADADENNGDGDEDYDISDADDSDEDEDEDENEDSDGDYMEE